MPSAHTLTDTFYTHSLTQSRSNTHAHMYLYLHVLCTHEIHTCTVIIAKVRELCRKC